MQTTLIFTVCGKKKPVERRMFSIYTCMCVCVALILFQDETKFRLDLVRRCQTVAYKFSLVHFQTNWQHCTVELTVKKSGYSTIYRVVKILIPLAEFQCHCSQIQSADSLTLNRSVIGRFR